MMAWLATGNMNRGLSACLPACLPFRIYSTIDTQRKSRQRRRNPWQGCFESHSLMRITLPAFFRKSFKAQLLHVGERSEDTCVHPRPEKEKTPVKELRHPHHPHPQLGRSSARLCQSCRHPAMRIEDCRVVRKMCELRRAPIPYSTLYPHSHLHSRSAVRQTCSLTIGQSSTAYPGGLSSAQYWLQTDKGRWSR